MQISLQLESQQAQYLQYSKRDAALRCRHNISVTLNISAMAHRQNMYLYSIAATSSRKRSAGMSNEHLSKSPRTYTHDIPVQRFEGN